ncbi:phage protein Gp36 family protein, partial [Faecalibaculum rodentium]
MNHWITLTADMLLEVIDQAELDAITAADTDGSVVDGIIQDVTASVREAIAANPANVMDLTRDTIPRTLRPEALDMIAWRLLKRFAVAVSESRDKAATSARERLEAVRAGTHRVIGPDGRM